MNKGRTKRNCTKGRFLCLKRHFYLFLVNFLHFKARKRHFTTYLDIFF